MTDYRVTVQQSRKSARWAYAIEDADHAWPFVSRHIFHSAEAARKAGEEDARLTAEFYSAEKEAKR